MYDILVFVMLCFEICKETWLIVWLLKKSSVLCTKINSRGENFCGSACDTNFNYDNFENFNFTYHAILQSCFSISPRRLLLLLMMVIGDVLLLWSIAILLKHFEVGLLMRWRRVTCVVVGTTRVLLSVEHPTLRVSVVHRRMRLWVLRLRKKAATLAYVSIERKLKDTQENGDRNNTGDNFEDNTDVNTKKNNSFGIVVEKGINTKRYADSIDAIGNTGEITEHNATKAVETKSETGMLCITKYSGNRMIMIWLMWELRENYY